ncbi:unnamed protein product, partial [marine sediment metagenome]
MSVNEIKITDNLYIYSSSRYHNINSSAFLTREGVLIIDTMLFPDDMKRVRRLVNLENLK